MTDAQPDEISQQLKVENALLRGSLYLAKNALKDYAEAKHVKTDQEGMLALTVPESLRTRAADAVERAQRMLKDEGRGR